MAMLHILVVLSGLSVVAEVGAQVANNMPNEPGDKNFPPEAESGEAVELEKGLPVIVVLYHNRWRTFSLHCLYCLISSDLCNFLQTSALFSVQKK